MTARPRRGKITAAELMTQLANDPEHQQQQRLKEQQRRANAAVNSRDADPVVEQLRAMGFPVTSIPELHHHDLDYQAAIPVLLDWLPKITNRIVQETIVRALSVPWAKPDAARPLIRLFTDLDDDPQSALRWAIGNALDVVADESVSDDLIDLALDRRYGTTRQMIVLALGKTRNPRAVPILLSLLDDDSVAGHAVQALRMLRPPGIRAALEPFTTHPTAWIRNEARRAIAESPE